MAILNGRSLPTAAVQSYRPSLHARGPLSAYCGRRLFPAQSSAIVVSRHIVAHVSSPQPTAQSQSSLSRWRAFQSNGGRFSFAHRQFALALDILSQRIEADVATPRIDVSLILNERDSIGRVHPNRPACHRVDLGLHCYGFGLRASLLEWVVRHPLPLLFLGETAHAVAGQGCLSRAAELATLPAPPFADRECAGHRAHAGSLTSVLRCARALPACGGDNPRKDSRRSPAVREPQILRGHR